LAGASAGAFSGYLFLKKIPPFLQVLERGVINLMFLAPIHNESFKSNRPNIPSLGSQASQNIFTNTDLDREIRKIHETKPKGMKMLNVRFFGLFGDIPAV